VSEWSQVNFKDHGFIGLLKEQMRAHALLVVSCILYFCVALIITLSLGKPFGFSAWPYLEMIFTIMVPLTFMGSLILVFFYMALVTWHRDYDAGLYGFHRDEIRYPSYESL